MSVSRRVGFALALSVPLALYLATLSGSSDWLDSGEFVAASVELDITHPPGHPLSSLYGKAFSLLPLGSLAFRVALGQACAAALAAALLFLATLRALSAMADVPERLRVPIAWLAPALWSASYATWVQAVRPEVYALQGMLLMLALERTVAAYVDPPPQRAHALYAATFAIALGLLNHHVTSVLALPMLLHATIRVARGRGLAPYWICTALGLLALSAYVYLPVRAAQHPPENLGDPRDLSRMFWVISARVYAGRIADPDLQPLWERWIDTGLIALNGLHLAFAAFSALGLYAALRLPARRALAIGVGLLAATALVLCPLLNAPRGNPDVMGYMIAGLAALALFASTGVAALIEALPARVSAARALFPGLIALAAAAFVGHVVRHHAELDRSSFAATDAFDDVRYRALPPRAVLIASTPFTVFRHFELRSTEQLRRDVTLVALPFLTHPGFAEALIKHDPELRELVASFSATQRLQPAPLLKLAQRRPVMLELDTHVAPSAYRYLLPLGALYAVVDVNTAQRSFARSVGYEQRMRHRLDAQLAPFLGDLETRRQLLWLEYMNALQRAGTGHPMLARQALARAQTLEPHEVQLAALAKALQRKQPGQVVDVRPLLELGKPAVTPQR